MSHSIHAFDKPKSLGDPDARADRQSRLHAEHVVPLTAFVKSLRSETVMGAAIPDFDPADGGVRAELLYLLEAPGAKAVASGFISRNNPDETAKNFFDLNQAAGIPRERTVLWNIVPWYIGTGTRIRAAGRGDIEQGLPSLTRLIALLPRLRTVVLLGRKAAYGADAILELRPDLQVLRCPHPSPLFVNRSPGNRETILEVLRAAARSLR